MPTRRITDEVLRETLDTYLAVKAEGFADGSSPSAVCETGQRLGLSNKGVRSRLATVRERGIQPTPDVQPEVLSPVQVPDPEAPTPEIIAHLVKRFDRRYKAYRSAIWQTIPVKMDGPIGIAWIGDPHVDDDGCNWSLLTRDLELIRKTEGMVGANVGDTTNSWIGRLTRLYADQSTTRTEARKLARWMLAESGVEWLVCIIGNHDAWSPDLIPLICEQGKIRCADWDARIVLRFPNKREARIHATHNFPGHSMWNTLHGPQKAAHMKAEASLYVCGHTHNWALHQEESGSRDFVYWLARARGYKWIDDYAKKLGHDPQEGGASILSIYDPYAKTDIGFLQCYADLEEGAEYLSWKRQKWARKKS